MAKKIKKYKKVHKVKKALNGHIKNIKKRGGKYEVNGLTITYWFE